MLAAHTRVTARRQQATLDARIKEYNEARSHQGRWCFGTTQVQTFLDAMDDEEENDRSPAATDTETRSLNQAPHLHHLSNRQDWALLMPILRLSDRLLPNRVRRWT
jgi:hypothetical protein